MSWDLVITGTWDDVARPYGENVQDYHGYRNQREDHGDDNYRLDQRTRTTPGTTHPDWDANEMWNYRCVHWHDWNADAFNNGHLIEYRPDTNTCGPDSSYFSINAGGPEFGWSYDHVDSCRENHTGGDQVNLHYWYESDGYYSEDNRDVRSVMVTDGVPYCDEYDICTTSLHSKFWDINNDEHSRWVGYNVTWYGDRCPV